MSDNPQLDISLSVRARNVLARAGIETVEKLACLTDEEILSFPNSGTATLHELHALLERKPPPDFAKSLTKRELFAALAMQAYIHVAHQTETRREVVSVADEEGRTTTEVIASCAVEYADALLRELGKEKA